MNSRFRNWSDVRVFLAVVREGSTLAASKVLGMAQPTVARRIDVLEHELGMTLFDRDTRGFTPTKAGKALLPLAQAIADAATSFDETAQSLMKTRPIRITAFSESVLGAAANLLSEFSSDHPQVTFEFLPSLDYLNLTKGEADVALRFSRTEQDPALIAYPVSLAQFTIYAAPSYIARRGKPTSVDELRHHDILTSYREGQHNAAHVWFVKNAGQAAIKASFAETIQLDIAIKSGRGIGLRNVRLSRPEVAKGTLVQCIDPPKELEAKHQILISPQAYRRPEVKAFAKFFVPRYQAMFK